jgi:solute carrier family 31 (copper transporter), member 1
MFAGSCIGVIFLVLSLEFLRRLSKEYDRFLARQYRQQQASQTCNGNTSEEPPDGCINAADRKYNQPQHHTQTVRRRCTDNHSASSLHYYLVSRISKPDMKQQLVRALLHMLQLGVAYFIMLLAMYYNGYLIMCILIGAFLGAFIFGWDTIAIEGGPDEDPTVCCG